MGITAAVAAVAGTGYAIHSGEMQKKSAESAKRAQEAEIAKQDAARAEQDRMAAETTARENASMAERRRRAASGRSGLLYASATGVEEETKTTLG